jgi:hypothetical protein
MARQLRRLTEMSRRRGIAILVVPFDQAVYPGLHGPFRALLNSLPGALDVVETTHRAGNRYVAEPEQVEGFRLLFDEVRSSALSSRRSLDLISQISAEFEGARG